MIAQKARTNSLRALLIGAWFVFSLTALLFFLTWNGTMNGLFTFILVLGLICLGWMTRMATKQTPRQSTRTRTRPLRPPAKRFCAVVRTRMQNLWRLVSKVSFGLLLLHVIVYAADHDLIEIALYACGFGCALVALIMAKWPQTRALFGKEIIW